MFEYEQRSLSKVQNEQRSLSKVQSEEALVKPKPTIAPLIRSRQQSSRVFSMTTLLIDCTLPRSISSQAFASEELLRHIVEVKPSMQFVAEEFGSGEVLDNSTLNAVMAAPDESYAVTSRRLMMPLPR